MEEINKYYLLVTTLLRSLFSLLIITSRITAKEKEADQEQWRNTMGNIFEKSMDCVY